MEIERNVTVRVTTAILDFRRGDTSGVISEMRERNNPGWILVPVAVVVALIIAFIGLSLYFRSVSATSYYDGPPFFGWWFPFGGFFFIPIIILVFFGFRWFFWGGGRWWSCVYPGQYHDAALDTLRQRFARGEITKEEFDDAARKLQQKPGEREKS